jgi:hypothetical protein
MTMRKTRIAALIALAVTCSGLGQAREIETEGARRFLLRLKPGLEAGLGENALKTLRMRSGSLREISAAGKEGRQFKAWVAELSPQSLSALEQNFNIEEDVRLKWIEETPSLQSVTLPSLEAVLRELPSFEPAALVAPREIIPWGVRKVRAPSAGDRGQRRQGGGGRHRRGYAQSRSRRESPRGL